MKTITRNTISPRETSELIEAMTGEVFAPRALIYRARHRTGGFPKLKHENWSKFFRFDRDEVLQWIAETFAPEKNPSSVPERAATRRRAKAS
jgi:hypothetical protein